MIKVVLVEDSELESEIYKNALCDNGFEVTVVNDPRSAMRTIGEVNPDLIVLDVEMPNMDGITLCQMIKNKYHTPVMMLTGSKEPRHISASISLGCVDFLNKPVSAAELLTSVQGHGIVSIVTETLTPMRDALMELREKYK